jgi:thiol-disulfide isomerase/thioredoxin
MHRATRRRHPARIGAALLAGLVLTLAAGGLPRAQGFEQNPLLLDIPTRPVPALDFTGETLGGQRIRLSDFRGQIVMLNFWATWCTPCLLEMPAMDRLSRKLKGRPFKLLAINQAEERAQVEKFAREHPYAFEWVLDPSGEIGSTYGANRLPMTYLLDKEGRVIRRAIGPREWDSAAALRLFETLLDQPIDPAATARTGP